MVCAKVTVDLQVRRIPSIPASQGFHEHWRDLAESGQIWVTGNFLKMIKDIQCGPIWVIDRVWKPALGAKAWNHINRGMQHRRPMDIRSHYVRLVQIPALAPATVCLAQLGIHESRPHEKCPWVENRERWRVGFGRWIP